MSVGATELPTELPYILVFRDIASDSRLIHPKVAVECLLTVIPSGVTDYDGP
jgi:hypothetical protein